jgi:hypothetical protein
MGKVELMPVSDTHVSLLVLPLHQEFEERFNDRLLGKPEPSLEDRQMDIKAVMFRQNVHLALHEVEELIEKLQDYVAWRKNEQA